MQADIITLKKQLEIPTVIKASSATNPDNRYAAFDQSDSRKNTILDSNKSESKSLSSSSGFTAVAKREEERQRREELYQERANFLKDKAKNDEYYPRDHQHRQNIEEPIALKSDLAGNRQRNHRSDDMRDYLPTETKTRGPVTQHSHHPAWEDSLAGSNQQSFSRTQSFLDRGGSPSRQRGIDFEQRPIQDRKEKVKEDIEK